MTWLLFLPYKLLLFRLVGEISAVFSIVATLFSFEDSCAGDLGSKSIVFGVVWPLTYFSFIFT